MIELTDEQARELAQPEPVAIDPRTRERYVLVRRETYERLKALLALDEYDPDEGAALINGGNGGGRRWRPAPGGLSGLPLTGTTLFPRLHAGIRKPK